MVSDSHKGTNAYSSKTLAQIHLINDPKTKVRRSRVAATQA